MKFSVQVIVHPDDDGGGAAAVREVFALDCKSRNCLAGFNGIVWQVQVL